MYYFLYRPVYFITLAIASYHSLSSVFVPSILHVVNQYIWYLLDVRVTDIEKKDTIDHFSVIHIDYQFELFQVRMEILSQIVFREPDGQRKGLVFSSLSFICLLVWVYTSVVLNDSHFFLFFALVFGFSGFAELLSPDRRRSAGVLWIAAVGILVVFLVLRLWIPELLLE